MKAKIQTNIESISPTRASEYLKRNKTNRPLKDGLVEQYALDMRKGHWLLNHQGIAFDTHGHLIDGQHRLRAVELSGSTIPFMVTTGLPVAVENGLKVFTMDTVDRGKLRSIGDQLVLRHGCTNGNLTAAAIQTIGIIALNGQRPRLTVPTATAILDLYRREVECAVENRSSEVGIRSSVFVGAIAFALKTDRAKVQEFYTLITSGEGLYKSGATSSAYALRKFLCSTDLGGSANRWRGVCVALNAAKHFSMGMQVSQLKNTSLGVEYFVNRQKSSVAKIVELTTI